jgi:NADPH2:quinone reductase
MKAVRFHKVGAPEVLVYEDVSEPTPGAGEVLIRVEATGVNFADIMQRRGDSYLTQAQTPFILGAEIAGTVVALGAGVTSPAVGSRIVALSGGGGYAQFAVAQAKHTVSLTDDVSYVEAVTVLVQGLTASLALRSAGRLVAGETVLIEAAAGGVGSFAVQLARLFGASKVIAAASTPEKRAYAERLGADGSVDYTADGWSERVRELSGGAGVDVVLELVGGDNVAKALAAVAPFGRMVFVGKSAGTVTQVDPWDLLAMNHTVVGFGIYEYFKDQDRIQSSFDEIFRFVRAGELLIGGGKVLPLSKAAEAHRIVEGRESTGKVVLEPWVEV